MSEQIEVPASTFIAALTALGAVAADQVCVGCVHHIPGDCSNRKMGEDGYLHFPEGACREEAAQ